MVTAAMIAFLHVYIAMLSIDSLFQRGLSL